MTTDLDIDLATVVPPTADFSRGACRGFPTSMFFPQRGDLQSIVKARAVCAGCEIQEACLQFALDNNERFGIWGGLTGIERLRVRRRKQAV